MLDALPDGVDQPGELVARYMGHGNVIVAGPSVPVAAAHAGGQHPHHHASNRGLRFGDLPDFGLGPDLIKDYCAHAPDSNNWLPPVTLRARDPTFLL